MASSHILKFAHIALLCLSLFSSMAYAEENSCTIHDKGRYYDLNPLKSSKDYQLMSPGGQLFPINVCQNVRTETYGVKDDIKDADIASFIRRSHGDFVVGKVNTTLSVYDDRPRLLLSGGSRCKSSDDNALEIHASTLIDFICDTSVFGSGQPRLIAQLPPGDDNIACAFVVEWRTHFACPTSESGGVWGVFAILAVIFLVILMTYTVLGTLYNRYILQLRGFDQIPQFSIESMKYHGREAVDRIQDIIAGFNSRPGGASFGGVDNARTPNSFSHHAQAQSRGDIESHDDSANSGRVQSNFLRPAPSRKRETNPVSHQTQVINSASQQAQSVSYSNPSPPLKLPAPVRTNLEIRHATKAEREFMLGDDDYDDDDGEELDFVKPNPADFDHDPYPDVGTLPSIGISKGADPSVGANSSVGVPATSSGSGSGEGK